MHTFFLTFFLLTIPLSLLAEETDAELVHRWKTCQECKEKNIKSDQCSAELGGPCYRGLGGPLDDSFGGPLYHGHGGNVSKEFGGRCHQGFGGNCYQGTGGNCYYSDMKEKCPEICFTICEIGLTKKE